MLCVYEWVKCIVTVSSHRMASQQISNEVDMVGNMENNPFPEGINAMNCVSDGKVYVINEILNFYQRKLSILTIEQVKTLSHLVFDLENLAAAKAVLLKLWQWRNCEPSSANAYIYKNLEIRRNQRKPAIANDIINFLKVEDANLGIVFLTLKCELIPSKVHETEAMRDIYVLMHERESEYLAVTESLNEKTIEIQQYSQLVTDMREQMGTSFMEIKNMIKEMSVTKNVSTGVSQANGDSTNGGSLEINVINDATVINQNENADIVTQVSVPSVPAVVPSTSATDDGRPGVEEEDGGEGVRVSVEVTEVGVVVTAEQPTAVVAAVDRSSSSLGNNNDLEPEEGEIRDDQSDKYDTISLTSFRSAKEMEQHSGQWSLIDRGQRLFKWFGQQKSLSTRNWVLQQQQRQQHQQLQQQQQQQQQQLQQQQQQQEQQQPQQQQQQHHLQQQQQSQLHGNRPSVPTANRPSKSHFLQKKQARNIILNDGGTDIPFSANKAMYKYEAFITNLSLDTDENVMKMHISRMLDAEVFLKPFRKVGASYLSFGLFLSSESDNLDLKMPGLWPIGTGIYNWNGSRGGYYGYRRSNGAERFYQGSASANGQGHGPSENQIHNRAPRQGQYRPAIGEYRFTRPDQIRLHNQHV